MELFLGEERRAIYVKTLIPGRGATEKIKEDVQKEYDILRKLYEGFAGMSHISVVRPLAVFPEYRTIVTEEAPGPTLQHRLARATRIWASSHDSDKASRSCYLAGKWLSKFQQLTYRGNNPFSADDIVDYCDIRLRDLGARPESGVNDGLQQKISACIDALSRQATKENNIVAGCHNDYAPHNMIAQDDHLYVLDLGFFTYDSTIYDVCRFWHRLETFKTDPLVSNSRISDYQESFLLGYAHVVNRDTSVFRLAECRFVLSSMCTLLKGGTRSFVRRQVDLHLYRKYLSWLKQECGNL
ncbi:MAG: phosphotransferase [Gammaproteobacteria bacterium]